MAESKDKTVPIQKGPVPGSGGKTQEDMKRVGRNRAKMLTQKKGG